MKGESKVIEKGDVVRRKDEVDKEITIL